MRVAPPALSTSPDLPFKYVAGDASIDLVNTVEWTSRGLEQDRIGDYDRFTRWAEGAGVVPARAAERLRREAANRPRDAEAAMDAARWVRWVLQRLYAAVAAGEPLAAALDDFNEILADALRRIQLAPAAGRRSATPLLDWAWRGADGALESPLWPVVWSAANLLASDEVAKIRVCAAPECGWAYVDRSRNGLRRWCQMEECGTREKSRRRGDRARRAARASRTSR